MGKKHKQGLLPAAALTVELVITWAERHHVVTTLAGRTDAGDFEARRREAKLVDVLCEGKAPGLSMGYGSLIEGSMPSRITMTRDNVELLRDKVKAIVPSMKQGDALFLFPLYDRLDALLDGKEPAAVEQVSELDILKSERDRLKKVIALVETKTAELEADEDDDEDAEPDVTPPPVNGGGAVYQS